MLNSQHEATTKALIIRLAVALARQAAREDDDSRAPGGQVGCALRYTLASVATFRTLRSITDQLGLLQDHAARQGWQVVAEFTDAAISGASLHNRPGLLALIEAAEAGGSKLSLLRASTG